MNHSSIVLAILLIAVLCPCAATAADKIERLDDGGLRVHGVATLGSPTKGFEWKQIATSGSGDSDASPRYFVCRSPHSNVTVALMIDFETFRTRDERLKEANRHFNHAMQKVLSGGFQTPRAIKPTISRKKPNEAPFAISVRLKSKDAPHRYFRSLVYFGKQTFVWTAVAEKDADAQALLFATKQAFSEE